MELTGTPEGQSRATPEYQSLQASNTTEDYYNVRGRSNAEKKSGTSEEYYNAGFNRSNAKQSSGTNAEYYNVGFNRSNAEQDEELPEYLELH